MINQRNNNEFFLTFVSMKLHFMLTVALGLLLVSCKQGPEVFNPELYAWEEARDSIIIPHSIWKISCGSPDKAIYRYGADRLAPGVACERGWLFEGFMLCEKPCEGEDLPDYWLNPVYGTVAALEMAIDSAAAALGEPAVKRVYTIGLPTGASDEEYFAYLDRVREMAAALSIPHLELLGFTCADNLPKRVMAYAAACHEAILDEKESIGFDYSAVEDIMDQPGVKSPCGKYTLKDVPSRQQALLHSLAAASSGTVIMDCGINTLVQLGRSSYTSDKELLNSFYTFILERNKN